MSVLKYMQIFYMYDLATPRHLRVAVRISSDVHAAPRRPSSIDISPLQNLSLVVDYMRAEPMLSTVETWLFIGGGSVSQISGHCLPLAAVQTSS